MANKKYHAKQSEDKLTIVYEEDDFKKSLPNLYKELQDKDVKNIASIPIERLEHKKEDKKKKEVETRPKELYDPGVCDFIRRCSSDDEALEIIDYCLSRGEISAEEAKSFKNQLAKKGLDSFGAKKTPGYYQRKYLRTTEFSCDSKKDEPEDDDGYED